MKIGEQIKQIRKRHNISQDDLAEQLAVSRQAVSKWERGVSLPDIENLMYISNLYNVSLDELIKNDNSLSRKLVADSAAKKWHILSIIFFATQLLYIVYAGFRLHMWMVGLAVATIFMLAIDIAIVRREKTMHLKKLRK